MTLQVPYWEDVRKCVATLNPELANIVDGISPDKRYPLVKWSHSLTQRYWQAYDLHWQTALAAVQLKPFASFNMAVFRLRQFAHLDGIWSTLYTRLLQQTLHLSHFVPSLHKAT